MENQIQELLNKSQIPLRYIEWLRDEYDQAFISLDFAGQLPSSGLFQFSKTILESLNEGGKYRFKILSSATDNKARVYIRCTYQVLKSQKSSRRRLRATCQTSGSSSEVTESIWSDVNISTPTQAPPKEVSKKPPKPIQPTEPRAKPGLGFKLLHESFVPPSGESKFVRSDAELMKCNITDNIQLETKEKLLRTELDMQRGKMKRMEKEITEFKDSLNEKDETIKELQADLIRLQIVKDDHDNMLQGLIRDDETFHPERMRHKFTNNFCLTNPTDLQELREDLIYCTDFREQIDTFLRALEVCEWQTYAIHDYEALIRSVIWTTDLESNASILYALILPVLYSTYDVYKDRR